MAGLPAAGDDELRCANLFDMMSRVASPSVCALLNWRRPGVRGAAAPNAEFEDEDADRVSCHGTEGDLWSCSEAVEDTCAASEEEEEDSSDGCCGGASTLMRRSTLLGVVVAYGESERRRMGLRRSVCNTEDRELHQYTKHFGISGIFVHEITCL